MTIPITQWEAIGGVAHAWIAQCEGYVSLCGREVSGLHGQRSGIRCAQCAASSGWAEQMGESSYLTPQLPMDAIFNMMEKVRGTPRNIGLRQSTRPRTKHTPAPFVPLSPIAIMASPVVPEPEVSPVEHPSGLIKPASMDAYQSLPEPEQRYWAPVMLAHQGQDAVWDQAQETAEQFQSRCYAQLKGETR